MKLTDEQKQNIYKSVSASAHESLCKHLVKNSYKSFVFSKARAIILFAVFLSLFLFLFSYFNLNGTTLELIIERSNIIILFLLVITTLSYMIMQSALKKDSLTFLNITKEGTSGESVYNMMRHSMFFTIINYVFMVCINYILLTCIDMFDIIFENPLTYIVLMTIYCTYTVYWIAELKSFVYNLYQTFQIISAKQLISVLEEEEHEKE